MKAKKLIEVAMPIKEISAESVRDKYIHDGHLSTLHIWWARRPLPLSRAVIFSSIVPDPLDPNCPQAFVEAVQSELNEDLYRPYKDIPYTAIADEMQDNLRNRLMMFIARFSPAYEQECGSTGEFQSKDQLSELSLIRWENRNDDDILRKARLLIWIAYNSEKDKNVSYKELKDSFNNAFGAIKNAESELYGTVNRHIVSEKVKKLERNLREAIDSFQARMPLVFDPFAGGGAIPLEAARLGCRSCGNDINPVAHIIEKASAELPQKYGKPIKMSYDEFVRQYGDLGVKLYLSKYGSMPIKDVELKNRLVWDVYYYANLLYEKAEKEIGDVYEGNKEMPEKPSVYYWAKTVRCSNPSCKAEIPMLKQFYLSNKTKKKVYLKPHISGNQISFEIATGFCSEKPWNTRGNITCPCCGNVTSIDDVKRQSNSNDGLKQILLAQIFSTRSGKQYFIPSYSHTHFIENQPKDIPVYKMHRNSGGGDTFSWGITTWNQLYTKRQLFVLNYLADNIHIILPQKNEYYDVILTYLAILIDRIASYSTSFGRWIPQNEQLTSLFGRQAISFTSDFPEMNIFSKTTSGFFNQLELITSFLESEQHSPFSCKFLNASSGDKNQFKEKEIDVVVTDPPYYNAIAYADNSDFFYMWLKKTLSGVYPDNFSTPQTPKKEECTALKHHHNNSENEAKRHFETKLTQIFETIEKQTSGIVCIMFAHQSTEAWTTLCNSILNANMNITGSWAIDSERDTRMVANSGSALESSVTVACRPSERKGFGEFREVKRDIERKVKEEVESLYALGFRGADLLTACFGQAVSEFGRYKTVEKADGSTITVAELLDLAKQTAFNALLQGIDADDETRFYIGWLQMNGMGETDYDDATKFTRVGMNIEIGDIFRQGLLVRDGNKQHLATAAEHLEAHSKSKGTSKSDLLIEQVHRAMLFYKGSGGDRRELLRLIRDVAPDANDFFWRVLASLKELLPAGDDLQQVQGLLQNGENLRRECKDVDNQTFTQGTITFGE